MAATTPKRKKNARKVAKNYQMVTFTNDLFEDEFELPDQKHFTVDVIAAVQSGDIGTIKNWLVEAKADPDSVDAFGSLDAEELGGFMEDWGKASKVSAPKSQG